MKRRIVSVLLATCLLLAMAPISAAAADAPAVSYNFSQQNYGTWSKPVNSYLFENAAGGLTRVEHISGRMIVEDYDSQFNLLAQRELPMELPIWGGFFAGETYHFVIVGQENPEERDDVEVVRVIKYDKDWNRLGHASLRGANTTVPFDAGSLRCAEENGMLYVHTAHTMYTEDTERHQANLRFSVRQSDMEITDSFYGVWNASYGYISHSFNQFILIDQDKNIITLDHGDAHLRAPALLKYEKRAGGDLFTGLTSYIEIQTFPGEPGENATGATLGGLAETSSGYITAYSYDGVGDGTGVYNIYISHTDKENFRPSGTTVRKITSYTADGTCMAGTPVLVPTGLDGGYILWSLREKGSDGYFPAENTFAYAQYFADGSVSEIKMAEGDLSDCQPIVYNGKATWYVTKDSAPVFHTLDSEWVVPGPPLTPTPTPMPGVVASGKCGDNVAWTLDGAGTLTISGTGPMGLEGYNIPPADYAAEGPWRDYAEQIKAVVVEDGVTEIVDFGFRCLYNLKTATIADSVTKIGTEAFAYTGLTSVKLPKDLQTISSFMFWATDLPRITIPTSVTTIGTCAFGSCPALTDVYYAGTEEQWKNIAIDNDDTGNDYLLDAYIHFGGLPTQFTDVPVGQWYADAVKWALEQGITTGASETTFAPNNSCDRAQIVTFLWRANGSPKPESSLNPFTDIKAGDYFYEAALWAYENGITTGTSETTFAPDLTCTRAQAVTFQWRAAGKPAASASNAFTDVESGAYYTDAVAWAVEQGITTGASATTFAPNGNCTRAQIVTFLWRAAANGP